MKRHFFLGLLSLLALVACVKGPEPDEGPGPTVTPSPALAAIDSLTWRRPDSALALLLPWFDTCRDAMLASPTNKAGGTALETHSMRLWKNSYFCRPISVRK
ncbi:MAG: hypothetical protein IJP44_11245 [Bacteroidales bacterium]|nr:hypothetical protein [Bacteroidales bacterium]